MSAYDFTPVDIPGPRGGAGRPAEPNPFLEQVASLVDGERISDVALQFRTDESPDSKEVERVKRQLARAGAVHGVSVFKRIEEDGSGGSVVTFWAQSRVGRRPSNQSGTEGGQDGTQGTATDEATQGDNAAGVFVG